MNYLVIDTCIVLHILRGKEISKKIISEIDKINNVSIIVSTVTKAELESMKIQNNWGGPRCKALDDFLKEVTYIDISNSDQNLIDSYKNIDSFSKCKSTDLHGKKLIGSSRNMGKNDLWIAATALTLKSPLMTADGDFDHLNKTFIDIIKISQ